MVVDEFPQLWAELNPRLGELVAEAAELRNATGNYSVDETVSGLHSKLVDARRAQDRLEAILAEVGRLRSRARIAVSEAQDRYDDQWREVMQRTRVGEYSSAQERNATYQAGSVEQLVVLRRAKRVQADVDEAYDYIQIKFRGLDSARRDLDARVRLISLEGRLES